MVMVVKSEWHQVERRDGIDIDVDILQEIYPDYDEEQIQEILDGLESGEHDIDEIISDAFDNDVELDWQYLNQDDWWTDRKGGYEITYKVEDWEYRKEYESPKTHKCTKCRWTGTRWETRTLHLNEDGSIHQEDDLEFDSTKDVCPMCDSDVELTPEGIEIQEKSNKLSKELDEMYPDEADESEQVEETVETTYQRVHPAGEYTIRIWGRTLEAGIGNITEAQYEYWSDDDHMYDLSDALDGSYDYEENKAPEDAKFECEGYYDFNDVADFYGYEEDDVLITITDSNNNEIYRGNFSGIFELGHGDEDTYWDCSEEVDEMYPNSYGNGFFLMYKQGGKGSCMQHTITVTEEFDLAKFKIHTVDVDGISHVKTVFYGDEELDDQGMDSEHDNWRGQWSDFQVHKINR